MTLETQSLPLLQEALDRLNQGFADLPDVQVNLDQML